MIKGTTGAKKGGFVELQDDAGPPPPLPPPHQQQQDNDQQQPDLEDVSLSGNPVTTGPSWLAPGRARRGSSDETAPTSTASFPSSDDLSSQQQGQEQQRPGRALLGPAAAGGGKRLLASLAAVDAGTAKGVGWLAVALLLASLNPSVLARLLYKSAAAEEYVYTPVSILGAASLCGLLAAVRAFWPDLCKARSLSRYEGAFLLMTALAGPCLSAFYLVDGLRLTSVPITAVLSRLDAVFLLASAFLVTSQTPTTSTPNTTTRRPLWSATNAALLLLGALLAAFTRDPRLPVEHGDWAPVSPADGSDRMPSPKGSAFLALGALLAALTQLSTRLALQRVPLGLIITTRLLVAYVMFHPMALAYGGVPALKAIYHPRLWLTMLWYAPAFVLLLEYSWLRAIRACPPWFLACGLASLLVFELLWARVLLHQPLTFGESIAAGLALTATLSAVTERWYRGEAEAWTEEDEGAPPAPVAPTSSSTSKPGDLEEAKEELPSTTAAATVVSTLTRRRFVDTAGVAPGREVTLRNHFV